jgi:16S rRNA (cytosine1402-N4)-methyltransferase
MPNEPICKCKPPMIEIINKKPITAKEEELKENPPSRSAKLRVAKKISSWEN